MKFGKTVRREMHNNANMHYLNYKLLKKLIKNMNSARSEEEMENSKILNDKFENVLHNDLKIIEQTFQNLFKEIMNIKNDIEQNFTLGIIEKDIEIKKENISFDKLLNILKDQNVSKEFFDFCVQLSLLSNKCKIIRTYVIYNYIGLIKILKKKKKHSNCIFQNMDVSYIISMYSWCLSDELTKLISAVNIISDEFMQKFTGSSVSIEKYICPICISLIHDPVTLNSCFHSLCWRCLATAIQKYSIDSCPLCRTKISYDKNSIKIDGILSQFLKKHFVSLEDSQENTITNGDHFIPKPCQLYEDDSSYDSHNFEKNVNLKKEENVSLKKLKSNDKTIPNGKCDKNFITPRECSNSFIFNDTTNSLEKEHPFFQYNKNSFINKERAKNKCSIGSNFINLKSSYELIHGSENLNKYLSVLNKDDLNMIYEKEKESDCSDDYRYDIINKMDINNLKLSGEDDCSIINNVISYIFS